MQAAMATWAARDLPARLDANETAKLLGFAEHDIQILMATRKLTPLGDPAPNAPKWFGAIEVIRLGADQDWLNKATKEVSKYWRQKRERQENRCGRTRNGRRPEIVSMSKQSHRNPDSDVYQEGACSNEKRAGAGA